MITPEQAKTIALKNLPKGIELGPVMTDYKGHYVFSVVDPDYIGYPPLGVNKLTGSVRDFNYMDPGLIKASRKQHPEFFAE